MAFSNKILYKQYIDIRNQTNKNIIQKQGYLIGHLKSNVKLSPQHPQWSRHCERPQRKASLKKEIRVPFKAPLILSKWYGVTTYFSLYKKKKKKKKYMTEEFHSLIE